MSNEKNHGASYGPRNMVILWFYVSTTGRVMKQVICYQLNLSLLKLQKHKERIKDTSHGN